MNAAAVQARTCGQNVCLKTSEVVHSADAPAAAAAAGEGEESLLGAAETVVAALKMPGSTEVVMRCIASLQCTYGWLISHLSLEERKGFASDYSEQECTTPGSAGVRYLGAARLNVSRT